MNEFLLFFDNFEDTIDEIHATLISSKIANFQSSYKIDDLKTELDFFMGKISKKASKKIKA